MDDITVIVPVIEKHFEVLPRAIESIQRSTLMANVLLVDDSGAHYTYPNVKTIHTTGHTGSAHARNMGIDQAQTPLIFFLDADDYLLENGLEVLYKGYHEYDEACYLYGDWYQFGKGGDLRLHLAKPYSRPRLIRHTIHTVNILIAKDTLQAVNGFDETFPAWEDYDLFIRLALNGYCGVRVPYPIIVYDMLLGVNRERHDRIGDMVHTATIEKYKHLKGEDDFMACQGCGGNKPKAKPLNVPLPQEKNGLVTLEYTGVNAGVVKFMVQDENGKTFYRGANDSVNKYLQVPPHHAEQLVARGVWRKVVRAAKPSAIPPPQDFEAWRAKQREHNERAKQAVEAMTNPK